MEQLATERGGYWFNPEELEMAQECADAFTKYIEQSEAKKRKNK
jgi:hypothetical protein